LSSATFFFEPVRLLVESRDETASSPTEYEHAILRRDLQEYFFKKTIVEDNEAFEELDIRNEIYSVVSNAYESVASKFKKKLSSVIPDELINTLVRIPNPDNYLVRRALRFTIGRLYVHKDSPSLIIPVSSNIFYILSKEPKYVQELVEDIRSRCEDLNKITKDFGLELTSFLTSKEYQRYLVEKISKVKKIDYGKPKNPLEEDVIKACSRVTSSFLSNINIQFVEPTESFEYDLYMHLPIRKRIVVEATDYQILKEEIANQRLATETLKSKIVLATLDKAQRLNAQSIVIVNGFPEDVFLNLKTIADSRGVILMNETDYRSKLPAKLCEIMLSALSRLPRTIEEYMHTIPP